MATEDVEGTAAAGTPRLVFAICGAVAALTAAFAALHPFPCMDTLCRYAPMAEAFAAGNWSEAFHPRFATGMPFVAGMVRLATGLDGLSACAAVATLAWAMCAIPLFSIADSVFGRTAAWFALVLFFICPQPLLWALKGLREPFKMLGVLLTVDAILRGRTGGWRAFAVAAGGFSLLLTFKCDTVLTAFVLALAFAVVDRFGRRTWVLAGFSALILQANCWLVYVWTGYWLPVPHLVRIWTRLNGG